MIKVSELSKSFGLFKAVDSVSISVQKGEVLGFLGPNGAGKTTTMRLITGYLEPDEGKVEVGGIDVSENSMEAKALIGYLPENAPVYRDMNVKNFLLFVSGIRGLSGKQAAEAIDRAVSICHLEPVFYQSIDTLSKGYIRRCSFAQAIIHDPPVLILDEPTDGLDPNQKFEVRQMIREMGKEKAIIISTHILEEVDACCSRATIISEGKIVANGTPAELRARSSTANTIIITVSDQSQANEAKNSFSELNNVEKITDVSDSLDKKSYRIFPTKGVKPIDLLLEIASIAHTRKMAIEDIRLDEGRLDDVFRQITKNEVSL